MISPVATMRLCRRKTIAVGWTEMVSSVVITQKQKFTNKENLTFERLDPYRT